MSVYQTTPRPLPVGTLTTHRIVTAIEHVPVSYTHLTLPTILLV